MLVVVLLWEPMSGLAQRGPLTILVLLLMSVFVVSLLRASLAMTRALISGRYDASDTAGALPDPLDERH